LRYAIYFVPDPDSVIADLGARWLGYDIETGTTFAAPIVEGLEAAAWSHLVSEPARYGLHATLKAPFRLAESRDEADLVEALRNFARSVTPVRLPVMSLADLRGFFALVPAVRNEAVEELAARALSAFEPFRAPLTQAETARRRAAGLNPRQQTLLEQWGYPYVLDEAGFHITVTGRIDPPAKASIEAILTDVFEPAIGRAMIVDRVALAVEREPGAHFEVLAAASLGHPLAFNRRAIQIEAL
jgi:putative phosphonate metabolism protein